MFHSRLTIVLAAALLALPMLALAQDSAPGTDGPQTATGERADNSDSTDVNSGSQPLADLDAPPTGPATGPLGGSPAEEASEAKKPKALFTNDAIVFGLLMILLGAVFWSCNSDVVVFKIFYRFVPMLLMCYFLPSLLTLFNLVDPHESDLYTVATRYLLPASLVLLTLSIDLGEIFRLGPKALIMFLTGTIGVVIGGPIAVMITSFIAPDVIGVDGPAAVWRGLSTVAGSWIGGGANQTAMQVVFMTPAENASLETQEQLSNLYSAMVAVDVLVAEFWMVFLLLGIGKAKEIDRFLKADSSSIARLQEKMEQFSLSVARVPTSRDLMLIGAIGFGATAAAHWFGQEISSQVDALIESTATNAGSDAEVSSPYAFLRDLGLASSFFWIIVVSTTLGIALSFTKFRELEGAGASKVGTVFIFILVAVIGMRMDLKAVFEHPGYFLVGGIWMLCHVGLLAVVAWFIRAPYFFVAVGSKANIGGAASAPVVAAAFHPSLAPVGVLLAVLGYALGTYGAMLCAWLMQFATPG